MGKSIPSDKLIPQIIGKRHETRRNLLGHISAREMWLLILAILIAAWVCDLAFGSVAIPIPEVIKILFGAPSTHTTWNTIILDFRLPKSLTALIAGAALSVAGLQMQTLFRNPLADPYVLGISSGASMGAAIVIMASGSAGFHFLSDLNRLGDLGVIVSASLGAALVLAVVMLLARRVHSITLLVVGVMVGYIANALVRVLIQFSLPESVQAYLAWTFGSFGSVSWSQMPIYALVVGMGMLLAVVSLKPLNALLLGETYAHSLGIPLKHARWVIIVSTALLAGSVTAFCGLIGFIGIAVPHMCRSLFRDSDHRQILPASMVVGGIVALFADLVAQLPGSAGILPLNSVTALIGAPVVIWIILKQRNLRSAF